MTGSKSSSNDGEPIFVVGRQHSGNTMLATLLGQHPDVYAFVGEGTFFEHRNSISTDRRGAYRVVQAIEGGRTMQDVADVETLLSQNPPHQLFRFFQKEIGLEAAPLKLYRRGKQKITEANLANRWVQKATSYAFYVDDILEALPSSRMIFLLRNPLDLGASLKRRGGWHRVLRMVWGWNRSVSLSHRWRDNERVQLVKYEDLVRRPESLLRKVCAFAELNFDEALLEVPHVNRSETPYNSNSSATGLDDSRVYYYRDVLSPEEEAVVRAWVNTDRLQSAYPDLPAPREHGAARRIRLMIQAMGGLVQTLAADHASTLMQNPGHVLDRVRRRI
ncbi:hypothetical protein GGP50_002646 [Salinibacter ruber]|uniref:sulfotransferase family protein n=1 Tax=Salinibacter ruber TaxID=146919 RepID=UPI0024500329|nr:hypothetical protein [Salinibacter ruber]